MPHLPLVSHLHPMIFGIDFTNFAVYLVLSICIFATYLQGANMCKSIFSSVKVG